VYPCGVFNAGALAGVAAAVRSSPVEWLSWRTHGFALPDTLFRDARLAAALCHQRVRVTWLFPWFALTRDAIVPIAHVAFRMTIQRDIRRRPQARDALSRFIAMCHLMTVPRAAISDTR
jgi:hypothetical protein